MSGILPVLRIVKLKRLGYLMHVLEPTRIPGLATRAI